MTSLESSYIEKKLDHLRSCTCCLHKTMVRTLASPPGLVDMGKVLATAQQIATEVEYNDCREHWSTSPKKNKPNKRKPVELQVFVHKKPAFGTLFQSCSLSLGFFGFPVVLGGNPHRRFPFLACKSPERRGPNHFNGLRVVMELRSREGLICCTNIAKSEKRFVPKTRCWSEDLPRPRKVAKIHFLRLSLHSVNMS